MLKLFTLLTLLGATFAQGQSDLAGLLTGSGDTAFLAAMLGDYTEVKKLLADAKNVTLLAPSNDAIETFFNSSSGSKLMSQDGGLAAVLSYHILNGTYASSAIGNDSVFVPTKLTDEEYTNVTSGQRVQAVSLDGNVTFFSGLNDNVTVVSADQNFTGGVLHIIDRVLTIPIDIKSTLVNAKLSALYGALLASDLLDAVNGLKDVTIFAPDNSAFQQIASAVTDLDTEAVSKVLRYHVVNGSDTPLYSTDLSNGTKLGTLEGGELTVFQNENGTFVNGAKVVNPDILVAGGVVHVIDNVLNPDMATATVNDTATTGTAAFSGATSASDVPFTSSVPPASTTIGGGPAGASSSTAGAMPMRTGAVGYAALFGAGAALAYL